MDFLPKRCGNYGEGILILKKRILCLHQKSGNAVTSVIPFFLPLQFSAIRY